MHLSDPSQAWISSSITKIILIGLSILAVTLAAWAIPQVGFGVLGFILLPPACLIVLMRPELGLYLLVLSIPIENILIFGGEITAARLMGFYVVGAWLARRMLRREPWGPLLSANLTKASLAFLAFATLSTAWAVAPTSTYNGLFQFIRLLALGLIVAELIDTWERAKWLAAASICGGFVAAVLTIYQFYFEGLQRAGENVAGGINNTAMVLLLNMPLAFYLVRSQKRLQWRLIGILYVTLASVAISVTFSRTSIVFLILFFLLNFWDEIKSRRNLFAFIFLAILLVAAALTFVPRELFLARIQTIGSYIGNTFAGEGEILSIRGYIWRVGLAIFRDHPLLGVGFTNFRDYFGAYTLIVPGAPIVYSISRRVSSHNAYIGILAELGIPGLLLWLAILLVSIQNLAEAWKRLIKDRFSEQIFFAQAVIHCYILSAVYGFWGVVYTEKSTWLIFGLSLAVRKLSEEIKDA